MGSHADKSIFSNSALRYCQSIYEGCTLLHEILPNTASFQNIAKLKCT